MSARGIMSRRVVQPVKYVDYAGHRPIGAVRGPPTALAAGRPCAMPGPSPLGWPTCGSPEHVEQDRLHHEAGHSSCRYLTAQRSRPSRPVMGRPRHTRPRCSANHRIPTAAAAVTVALRLTSRPRSPVPRLIPAPPLLSQRSSVARAVSRGIT